MPPITAAWVWSGPPRGLRLGPEGGRRAAGGRSEAWTRGRSDPRPPCILEPSIDRSSIPLRSLWAGLAAKRSSGSSVRANSDC